MGEATLLVQASLQALRIMLNAFPPSSPSPLHFPCCCSPTPNHIYSSPS
eukprot:CAMPEP_0202415798 /NCGR_PEP_ID=MMETSP1128-20130828/37342_1 /ASSEMBLY_ACC=CAM_ASM_000463 /TAXON_ID=3047 /ORGANISM="Dunaliella tertiolecta, Strain CCMP1320" /LENGTH=48 /DNA_ID= /DNA_START= /DNA_END= /DNA_ORIENTATION=